MSELSPVSGVKLKSHFGVVRAAFDPERTSTNGKRCFEPTFSEFGEQVKVGAKGVPTYVDFRAYAYVEAGGGSAAAD
jgi:hypothetical protein